MVSRSFLTSNSRTTMLRPHLPLKYRDYMTLSLPQKLYKYQAFTAQALESLKAQKIYFGPPSKFNDPYDCAFSPHIKSLTIEEVQSIRDKYLSEPGLPPERRLDFQNIKIEQLREHFMNAGRRTFEQHRSHFSTSRGVTCFSEANDNLLMWSHYGDRYQGFCLEFDTREAGFDKVMPVSYSDELPTFDLYPMLRDDYCEDVMRLYTTKALPWAYEKEWRAIHETAGTQFGYPPEALSGVFFGPDISEERVEIICLILRGQNENVKFYHGRRSAAKFKVDFKEFSYMSYLEAKNLGLR